MGTKTKCFSVRVEMLRSISDKAVKITCFDGSSDIFPKSAIFGRDYDVLKCEAYWIAAWILPNKNIQWSEKKSAWFDEHGNKLPNIKVEKHAPKRVTPIDNTIEDLKR